MSGEGRAADSATSWKLYYHPHIGGRAEYIRLLFEYKGVPFEDVGNNSEDPEAAYAKVKGPCAAWGDPKFDMDGKTVFAPPFIQKNDGPVISQSPAIITYVSDELGMLPATALDRARVSEVVGLSLDIFTAATDAYHPLGHHLGYKDQIEEANAAIEQWTTTRLPRMWRTLETWLQLNNNGIGCFVGNEMTAADLSVFQAMRGYQYSLPEKFAAMETDFPVLWAHFQRISAEPMISKYLSSGRARMVHNSFC